MILASAPDTHLSLLFIEASLTAVAVGVAFCFPGVGSRYFSAIEHAFTLLARRKALSVAVVGATAFLLRLAILPRCPIPHPYIPDEFSFLLAADTFASGRLTNPTPVMWRHFESIHINMRPTYMSAYFPAYGMVLAAGKVLFGHPWFGLLCVTALMCAVICWMLQGWLPPTWALLGGLLAVVRLGLLSFWINTYTGAGSVAALGGALVLGALPRLLREMEFRHGMLMALGIILLATSRPYEGLLLCLPVAFVLCKQFFFKKNRPAGHVLLRRAALPITLVLLGVAFIGYYNKRVTGKPTSFPYTVNRATYAIAPNFIWQKMRPEPAYPDKAMRDFYTQDELSDFGRLYTSAGFVPLTLAKAVRGVLFYAGIALLPPLIMTRRILKDRRIRFLVLCSILLVIGMVAEVFLLPYYLAPFTAAFYAIGLQAMRHLRQWKPGRQSVGLAITRLTVVLCFAMVPLDIWAQPLHLSLDPSASPLWPCRCHNPAPFGVERADVEARLASLPGKQLAIVRYSADHNPLDEWVYNAADIDHSKVIWARDLSPAENQQLIDYYKDRTAWLVQPDTAPVTASPYPVPALQTSSPK